MKLLLLRFNLHTTLVLLTLPIFLPSSYLFPPYLRLYKWCVSWRCLLRFYFRLAFTHFMLQRRCSLDAVVVVVGVLADVALPAFGFVVSRKTSNCSSSPTLPIPLPDRWGWAPHEIGVRASAKTDYSSRTCFDKQQFKTWCYFWFTPKTEYVTYTQYVYVIRPLLKHQPHATTKPRRSSAPESVCRA